MDCFIKKIFEDKDSKEAHNQFIRFGRGEYEGRAALSININKNIKISGSFEYTNDFIRLVADLGNFEFFGVILSKEKIDNLKGKEKLGIIEYEFKGDSQDVKSIFEKAYYMLLNVNSNEIKLKTKSRLPKPGKSGDLKIDDKFVVLEADIKYLSKIKDCFFWDIEIRKKAKISHTYEIKEIIIPKGEKDFSKIRLLAKRKGKIIRKILYDGKEKIIEKNFEI